MEHMCEYVKSALADIKGEACGSGGVERKNLKIESWNGEVSTKMEKKVVKWKDTLGTME